MRKWEELDFKEQTRALNVNVPLAEEDTTYTHVRKETAFIQLVSTGPYYFDEKGKVHTGVEVKKCLPAHKLGKRQYKWDIRNQKASVKQEPPSTYAELEALEATNNN